MKCVVDDILWIGNAADARNVTSLYQNDIAAVVDLAIEEPPASLSRELIYFRIPIEDGSGNNKELLDTAIQMVAFLIDRKIRTIVCCSAGISRSPAIACAAISIVYSQTLEESLTRLVDSTNCDVSPALWSAISEICKANRKLFS